VAAGLRNGQKDQSKIFQKLENPRTTLSDPLVARKWLFIHLPNYAASQIQGSAAERRPVIALLFSGHLFKLGSCKIALQIHCLCSCMYFQIQSKVV
jgi:hypothetical protein